MPNVLVSADAIYLRTAGLLNDPAIDLLRVAPPVPMALPRVVYRSDIGFDAGPCIMWEVERPIFEIDEVPY